ncbi:MAG: iron-sulfur cluster assembly scaffold protein [bacterium]|nr:iron-sulfur cluster assembly scaffold protein [bacterium]
MQDSLYHDQILSHYHAPKNYGLRSGFNIEARGSNPLCGDSITLLLKTEGGIISDVCFESAGCVISKAAASMLLENIKGKSFAVLRSITPSDMMGLLGVTVMPARVKCATLALDTLQGTIRF